MSPGVNLFIYRSVRNSAAAKSTLIKFGCKREESLQEVEGATEWKKKRRGEKRENEGVWLCFKR